jgi:hypothetical protein
VHAQRLADDAPDAVPRVERGERILEDDLHAPPQRAQLALTQVRDVLAVEHDPSAGRLVKPQQRPADGRLAATRLADEPERLAAADRQIDAVDRPQDLRLLAAQAAADAAPQLVVHVQAAQLEQRLSHSRSPARGARRVRPGRDAGT